MKRERDQYVKELINGGPSETDLRIGVVTRAGHKQYNVCWESGQGGRYSQAQPHQLIDWSSWSDDARRAVQDRIFRARARK